MALNTFLLYLATWTLVALSPGPAVMFSMSQAARHGMRGAVAGTAGILLGHVFVFGAVAFGLAALLASYSGAVTTIRIVGALYLIYLGVKMLLSKPRGTAPVVAADAPRHGGLVLQGLGVQLTNPKLLLFVLALLPQFISPDHPLLLQLAIMLTVTVIIDGIALLAYAHIAVRGARALKGSRALAWLERVFGGALIFFGLKLLISRK
ncbi:MAG TPA: LysE family translocator [Steroidobacteraceae bacterium]|jgi:homoserine/homoserine lactone efflux protein|nr:LysE family translocator [Steroidobacteraceae bacterium]